MKRYRWQIALGVTLLLLAAFIYWMQVLIFQDVRSTFYYMMQDLAFVPFEVLLVTLIIHRLLTMREKRSMLKKMNMVIGAFFSEAGTGLLNRFTAFDPSPERVAEYLKPLREWPSGKFSRAVRRMRDFEYKADSTKGDLYGLHDYLIGKRNFLLRLLENPNLLEHQSFTELLWAVFHLTEELACRPGFHDLPGTDYDHLSGDLTRAYGLLVSEWLAYMKHLHEEYPYLFSLAVRTNPFDKEASPVVKSSG